MDSSTTERSGSSLPRLSPEQRREYLAIAVAVRQERSRILKGIKKEEIDPHDVISDDHDAVKGIRVKAFVESWPSIGRSKAEAILERCHISGRRRLKGLGKNQREQLIAEMPSFGEDCDDVERLSADRKHKGL